MGIDQCRKIAARRKIRGNLFAVCFRLKVDERKQTVKIDVIKNRVC